MVDSVHLFLHDPSFLDGKSIFSTLLKTGGLCVPHSESLSYFLQVERILDKRSVRSPAPSFTTDKAPSLILDGEYYSNFVSFLATVPQTQRDSLFSIIDRIAFRYTYGSLDTALDLELSSEDRYFIYKEQSLIRSTDTESGLVYLPDGLTQTIVAPTYFIFNVTLSNQTISNDYELKVWVSNDAFYESYPLSHITAVVHPLPIQNLLTDPILGTGANAFTTALTVANLNQSLLDAKIKSSDNSGYVTYTAKFYNQAKDMTLVSFNILYKGQMPDRFTIRQAIKNLLLTSGIGTLSEWKARVPELFIDGQMYLIPLWNNLTTLPDQVVYPSILTLAHLTETTEKALPQLSINYIENNLETINAVYDYMIVASIPHQLNESVFHVRTLHPTYRAIPSTDPGFSYMDENTKIFSKRLSDTLAIAAGKSSNTAYTPITSSGANYIPFEVNFIEYHVMTKESYRNLVGPA